MFNMFPYRNQVDCTLICFCDCFISQNILKLRMIYAIARIIKILYETLILKIHEVWSNLHFEQVVRFEQLVRLNLWTTHENHNSTRSFDVTTRAKNQSNSNLQLVRG